MLSPQVFVGIDVAKAQLDIALRPLGTHWTVSNDDAGITDLVMRLQDIGPQLIVLEATGGYQRAVVAALAALVGVAPCHRDSGTMRGTRSVWGGRAHVRTTRYLSILVAVRYNPVLKRVYGRLCAAGKAPKVALTACMRKLLTILNAMVKHHTPWQVQEVPHAYQTKPR